MSSKQTVLYAGESHYGKYKVIDTVYNGRPARVLYGSQRSPQSGVAKDDDPELLFSYNQRFLELLLSTQPKRVLVIGGGAFMLPIAAFHRLPKLTLDVVEIDPLLVKLAQDFFELPKSKRLNVYTTDGVEFIKNTKKKYDFIIIDAFSGYTIPPHLFTKETLEIYKKLLTKKGSVAINFIAEYKAKKKSLTHELIGGFNEVFNKVMLYQADHDYPVADDQNRILVASETNDHFEYLQSVNILE